MTTEFLQSELNLELSGKQKLVYEAVLKMTNGKKMYDEGKLEFSNLVSDEGGGKVYKYKKGNKKTFTGGFRKEKRAPEKLKKQVYKFIKSHKEASKGALMTKLHISQRKIERLLEEMTSDGVITTNGLGGNLARIILKKKVAKEKKHINGHKLAKTPGGGGKRNQAGHKTTGRGGHIDVTDEAVVDKAVEFLKTHDWVNKGQFVRAIDLSPRPGNRLIEFMLKKKLIKEVKKANNPAHEKVKKIFVQQLPYLELA